MLKEKNNKTILNIHRIYTKDISFEAPNTPEVFQVKWNPKINVNLYNNYKKMKNDIYEVTLCITVTALLEKNIAFLCQVKQAGIFNILGLNEKQIEHCLNTYCPNILFPYVRECISNQISRGTFPSLNLDPVNFDLLFVESLKNKSNDLMK